MGAEPEIGLAVGAASEFGGPIPPDWLLLAPAGVIVGRDGRTFSNPAPASVVARFLANRADLPLDTEHATHIRAPVGLDAPAAGWITALEARHGEIWGRVSWTAAGAESVRTRAYRYYSPAYHLNQSQEVASIASVGLTNKPNLYVTAMNRGAFPSAPAPALTAEASRIAAAFGNTLEALARYSQSPAALHREREGTTDEADRIAAAFGNTPAALTRYGHLTTT
ncbi:phage protease [uncultured Thiodictyon sp.]|jgi:phage I-like protein|uniref:phage protease n=1 Tax=uncultured Thiodictyon sp. TaxID=1846217 RepID=UPI0025FC6524|nr:phage protease [uncultured Thiodictyon sp.]